MFTTIVKVMFIAKDKVYIVNIAIVIVIVDIIVIVIIVTIIIL